MRNRFLYFLPGMSGVNVQTLARLGLLSRFTLPGGTCTAYGITECLNGPKGSGCLVALGARPASYNPATQTWLESDGFWVGIEDKAFAPGPQDLIREVGFSGLDMVLADGQTWKVPVLRRWNPKECQHVSALPQTMQPRRGADGKMRVELAVSSEYKALDDLAEWIWASYCNQVTLPLDDLLVKCTQLLSANYRLGIEEIGLLGLLDQGTALDVLGAAVDLAGVKQHASDCLRYGLQFNDVSQDEPAIAPEAANG